MEMNASGSLSAGESALHEPVVPQMERFWQTYRAKRAEYWVFNTILLFLLAIYPFQVSAASIRISASFGTLQIIFGDNGKIVIGSDSQANLQHIDIPKIAYLGQSPTAREIVEGNLDSDTGLNFYKSMPAIQKLKHWIFSGAELTGEDFVEAGLELFRATNSPAGMLFNESQHAGFPCVAGPYIFAEIEPGKPVKWFKYQE